MFDYQRLVACLFGMLARAPGFGPVGKWCNCVSFTFLKSTSIFVQGLFSLPVASWLINLIYPLVNQHNYGKIHHLKWVNQLQKWAMASIANCNSHYQRVHPLVFHCQKAQVVGVTKPPTWQVPGAASSGVHRVVTVCDQHQAGQTWHTSIVRWTKEHKEFPKRWKKWTSNQQKDGKVEQKHCSILSVAGSYIRLPNKLLVCEGPWVSVDMLHIPENQAPPNLKVDH